MLFLGVLSRSDLISVFRDLEDIQFALSICLLLLYVGLKVWYVVRFQGEWSRFRQLLRMGVLWTLAFHSFGVFGHLHPVFPCLMILELFGTVPTFEKVKNSIGRPIRSILDLIILFVLMNYFEALIKHTLFYQEVEPICETLETCFLHIFDATVKYPAGYTTLHIENLSKYLEQWDATDQIIFDYFYIIVVILLMNQILSGVIIDTFLSLAREAEKISMDLSGVCLVCGGSSFSGESFKSHIKNRHNIWNYLYFMALIQSQSPESDSQIESNLRRKINSNDISWFPH